MKPKQKAPFKKTISTSALSKTTGRIEKEKKQQKSALKPEHPLATAFSQTIDQSRRQIKAQVDSELSPIVDNFLTRLCHIQGLFSNLGPLAAANRDTITQPLDEVELEWESNDKSRFGRTTLGNRINKLKKVVMAEETLIGHEMEQLRELNLELDHAAMEVMGEDAYEQVLQGGPNLSHWDPQQQNVNQFYGVEVELELEKARWADVIEATNNAAMNAMRESEKELNLRHDKMQQSFYQLLRDEDYC